MAVVEINTIVEVQHISNRKYNSPTINDECRQTIVCVDILMQRNEISIPRVK
jgi:hypothetical protein